MLISDIESSLNKINNFANWSCGILATISIFVSTTYINFLITLIAKEELSKILISEGTSSQSSLISILLQLMLIVVLFLLAYYLTVQAFTYDMRFVNTILKVVFTLMKMIRPYMDFGKSFGIV